MLGVRHGHGDGAAGIPGITGDGVRPIIPRVLRTMEVTTRVGAITGVLLRPAHHVRMHPAVHPDPQETDAPAPLTDIPAATAVESPAQQTVPVEWVQDATPGQQLVRAVMLRPAPATVAIPAPVP